MVKTMPATGRIKVYGTTRKYKLVYNGHNLYITLYVMPLEVKTEDGVTIAVGELASQLFNALRQHNRIAFRIALRQILPVAQLLLS
jgi:hypothetical protein